MRPLNLIIIMLLVSSSIAFADGPGCPGDATGDGIVDVDDLTLVLLAWGGQDAAADLDANGVVDIDDLATVILDWGCEALQGPLPVLTGTVTNMLTGAPVAGATVLVDGEPLVTDEAGVYEGSFNPGSYEVLFDATHFTTRATTVLLFPDQTVVMDMALEPVAPVVVMVNIDGDLVPGSVITATADVIVLDDSSVLSFAWSQTGGPLAAIDDAGAPTVTVVIGDLAAFKTHLFELLVEPPIDPEDLPQNVPPPSGEFVSGLQDRFTVVGLNPFVLEEAGRLSLAVEVTTTSGTYETQRELHANLPWAVTTGLRNVPIGVPVLLHGKDQSSYDWSMTRPAPSAAALDDPASQNPAFTPDVAGVYNVTVADEATGAPVTLRLYAGTWRGVIDGIDADGRPIASSSCTGCHGNLGNDAFEPWRQSGHAEIFTTNLNSSSYWGPQCFSCHGVGYQPGVANGGLDDAFDYQAFLASGLIGSADPSAWSTMLEQYPWTARLANVQCESCHGPQWGLPGQGSLAHSTAGPAGEPRVSLSSDVCATCHGEPLRHARFQQWQLSAHANYELAIDEANSGSCSRCHTANGFLAWLPILLGTQPGDPTAGVTVTWSTDEAHPQTCVTCHDPHAPGTTSGLDTDATVRISGHTPPLIAGFTAYGVGRGAICMTCHNSRRGLRNDETYAAIAGTTEVTRAPHGSAQADVLMGENAYLVTTGIRGAHSFVTDSCVTCHMEATPPPDLLAYNQGGTNHTFYASTEICADCHSGVSAETIQGAAQDTLDILQDAIEDALLTLIADQNAAGRLVDLDGDALISDPSQVQEIVFGEFRGRQAITVTLDDGSTLGPYRMTDVLVRDAGMTSLGNLYGFADPGLVKAGWNWALIENDGSRGVHNPSYAFEVLQRSIEELE